jgi:hypothetical protein
MPDESSASEMVGGGRPPEETFDWSAAMDEIGAARAAAIAPEADERQQGIDREEQEVVGESLELDLAAQERAETTGAPAGPRDDQPPATSSDRGFELERAHWRERAVVWRERAMAAELVAKMLQRNLDDLRANVEDLRQKVEAAAAADQRRALMVSSESPWRRFARDMYDKYLG